MESFYHVVFRFQRFHFFLDVIRASEPPQGVFGGLLFVFIEQEIFRRLWTKRQTKKLKPTVNTLFFIPV
jgi:hypothetical protein